MITSFVKVFYSVVKRLFSLWGIEIRRAGNSLTDPFLAQRYFCEVEKAVIFDIGGHEGETAVKFRRYFPKAKIYSIEPASESFRKLERSCSYDLNIIPLNMAVSDSCGVRQFYENDLAVTSSLLPSSYSAASSWGEGKLNLKSITSVQVVTLDMLSKSLGVDRINILKLDIQGGEHMALIGAKNLLTNHQIDIIFMEIILADTYQGQICPGETLALLSHAGYHLIGIYNPLYSGRRLIQIDALFSCIPNCQ